MMYYGLRCERCRKDLSPFDMHWRHGAEPLKQVIAYADQFEDLIMFLDVLRSKIGSVSVFDMPYLEACETRTDSVRAIYFLSEHARCNALVPLREGAT